MAATECNTFLDKCSEILLKIDEILKSVKSTSTEVKIGVRACATELVGIVKEQNLVIKLKNEIISSQRSRKCKQTFK
jgi:hypothetical protein